MPTSTGDSLWSRLRVSRDRAPVAASVSRRRIEANRAMAARKMKTTTMTMMQERWTCVISDQRSKNSPPLQGAVKLKPSPRKNEPMMTSRAQNIRKTVNNEIANLRSSGLLLGFLSM